MIIGQPKSISEMAILSDAEIEGISAFLDQHIASGTPQDIPQAISLGDLGRMVATVSYYKKVAAKALMPAAPRFGDSVSLPELPLFDATNRKSKLEE